MLSGKFANCQDLLVHTHTKLLCGVDLLSICFICILYHGTQRTDPKNTEMKVILGILILSLAFAWAKLTEQSSQEKGNDKTPKGHQITGKQVS